MTAPAIARVALARLLNPFGGTPWPRATHLAIRRPLGRVPRGEAFQIDVYDAHGTRLPSDVRLHYRVRGAQGGWVEQTARMRLAGGDMLARREDCQQPFGYRVEGGDDQSMPWHEVEVVEPPAVERLAVRLFPPAYTGLPPAAGDRHLRGLCGTRVEIAAMASKPLESARLCLEGGKSIPAEVAADGRSFRIRPSQFQIEKSGGYWFELTDREGVRGGADERWQIEAVADAAPQVAIEQPAADSYVASRAVLPLRVSASDDLAVRQVGLVAAAGDGLPEQRWVLYSGPLQPPRETGPPPLRPGMVPSATAASSNIAGTWRPWG